MCTRDSANAPEFFLHHGFIDKIWADWQNKSKLYRDVYFTSVNETLPGTELLPSALIDLSNQPGGISVEYDFSGDRAARNVMVQLLGRFKNEFLNSAIVFSVNSLKILELNLQIFVIPSIYYS